MSKRRDTAEEEVLHLPPDVELEAPFDEEPVTPVSPRCPDCGDDQVRSPDALGIPQSYGEACAIVRCWGTGDPDAVRWCRTTFTATWPKEGKRVSYDKRRRK